MPAEIAAFIDKAATALARFQPGTLQATLKRFDDSQRRVACVQVLHRVQRIPHAIEDFIEWPGPSELSTDAS